MKTTSITERFTALDIFRGLTICFMIIVNTSGNWATTYWPLKHADWNGFTPTDLVFPSFLFAVGNALSFVQNKWRTMKQSDVLWKILKRTSLIFLVGYLMYWFPFFKLDTQSHLALSPITNTRIFGVLQRIALCYGFVALLTYYIGTIKTIWVGLGSLIIYWLALIFFGDQGAEFSKTGNAVLQLDTWLFGANHLYMGEGFPFDPEGLLSTIPALFNVIGGYAIGRFLQLKGKTYESISFIMLIGAGLMVAAYFLHPYFPVNKKLWTSSFALLTVGLDCFILSAIIFITDIKEKSVATKFFTTVGKNPLTVYLVSELGVTVMLLVHIGNETLYKWLYNHIFVYTGEYFGAFLFSVWWMLMCWLVGYYLDKKKIYIKL